MIWLLTLAVLTRLPWLVFNTIPFAFDHGRDALAVLHLIKTLNPVFIGPWTSIPGLYFGPLWYYLLTPGHWLLQGNPLAGPWTMFFIGLIMIGLAFKYLGKVEAIIMATAPLWLQLSISASNAFPMGLVGLLLVIGLEKKFQPFWLGIIVGLGFHFSSALAVFWLVSVPLLFVKPKNWLKFCLGVSLIFIPQILFEIKHNFSQSQAVINYFAAGESQQLTPGKILIVSRSILHELNLAILPNIPWLEIFPLITLIAGIFIRPKLTLLILVPIIGFWFLHYNPWYAYGLGPLMVVLFAKLLRRLPKILTVIAIFSLFLAIGLKLAVFWQQEKQSLSVNKSFLPAKIQALNYVYNQAGDQPFASYQYHPEIYDYAYQYLYIWQGFKGKPLPVEFSYQPNAPTYINEKADLLTKLPPATGSPEKIFLIIEKPDNVWHYPFDSWLKQINFSEVVDKKIIGPELEVWQVIP